MGDTFNNREIAIAVWLTLSVVVLLTKREVRRSVWGVLESAVNVKIAVPTIAMLVYTALVAWTLSRVGLWDLTLLKDTIYWFVFVGLVVFGRTVGHPSPADYWKEVIKDQIAIIVVLTFIINTYTFSLPLELAIVPFAFTIGVLGAASELNEEYGPVAKVASGVQVIFGLVVLTSAVVKAIDHYAELATLANVHSLVLPIMLTVLALPFFYLIALYTQYDRLWVWTSFKQPPHLTRYMRRRLLSHGRLSLNRLTRLAAIKPYQIMRVRTETEFDDLLAAYARERSDRVTK